MDYPKRYDVNMHLKVKNIKRCCFRELLLFALKPLFAKIKE